MNKNDEELLRIARNTNYKEWRTLIPLASEAKSDIARAKIKNIMSILYEIMQDRGVYTKDSAT
jgi:hypothetical protein